MPILNRFAEMLPEITAWRHDFHRHPELQYDVNRTAGRVAELLESFGVDEVATGIGRTGVVGVIRGRASGSGRVIGLRADMDALPIKETTGKPYASTVPGKMHACGHDGHSAMLLGAARYLAETRNFDGTVVVIFQPAEEGGAGGRAMVRDGLMDRFGIQEVYGLHNLPGVPVGAFGARPGACMASADGIRIVVEGVGGHAAWPHKGVDPILVGSAIVTAIQSVAARSVDPLQSAVVSVTQFHAGDTDNVIPPRAELSGTVRTLDPGVRDLVEGRLRDLVTATAAAYGATAKFTYRRGYPVVVNDPSATEFATAVATDVAGADNVDGDATPMMGAEDFAFMLEARPGAFLFVGNGDSAGLHHPAYDFNDEVIPYGCSYWVRLAETAMPIRQAA
ncbi:M20 aminoacylase family protein [Amorphus orientalis]|uniref:Hippurate hydrolase n=1 Tax=Amorphus orientalis TaxID=649198 RepID=A0AAE3VRU6_9HYPH|nr:M20 aminoacylase family protein [Amorphus orientalis]MDQ0317045.1 hippurate hydrolase [Amorphus orientalis]